MQGLVGDLGGSSAGGNNSSIAPTAVKNTRPTTPAPYERSVQETLARIHAASQMNQVHINDHVSQIISGYDDQPLVFQAGEQGMEAPLLSSGQNLIRNGSHGQMNDVYEGLHQFWKDDMVGNLFSHVGQLNAKWLTEFLDGWIADAAQFLGKYLRVFVYNPNIATNGLYGNPDDGISKQVRALADIMYGIAVDLLLLLFILCIWKFWAGASWEGAGNLMAPVGRLIFTAGILLAWPTIYAFIIQISNEMIHAIGFNDADSVMKLDYALAQAIRGGIIAIEGDTRAFSPVLGNMASPDQFVGSVFHFACVLIYTIMGGLVVSELIYILILKAIQTALLVAQYMFAPIFLVFFATPDTESYATGYVKAFIETSLWTFVWVALLRLLAEILFSSYKPWGKMLITLGICQMMIMVPTFIGYAQISPASDFISGGMVYGNIKDSLKAMKTMGTGIVGAANNGISWIQGNKPNASGGVALPATMDPTPPFMQGVTSGTPMATALQNGHGKTSGSPLTPGPTPKPIQMALSKDLMNPMKLTTGGVPAANLAAQAMFASKPLAKPDLAQHKVHSIKPPQRLQDKNLDFRPHTQAHRVSQNSEQSKKIAHKPFDSKTLKSADQMPKALSMPEAAFSTAAALAKNSHGLVERNEVEVQEAFMHDHNGWSQQVVNEANDTQVVHQCTARLLTRLSSSKTNGLRANASKTSIVGSSRQGVQRVNLAEGLDAPRAAHVLYSAALADQISKSGSAYDAARDAVMSKRVQQNQPPQMLHPQNRSHDEIWAKGPTTQFQKDVFQEAVSGSQAYLAGHSGNAYTGYLKSNYGHWGSRQGNDAVELICNPQGNEVQMENCVPPNNPTIVPSGLDKDVVTVAALQNTALQTMHPIRRRIAVRAIAAYTQPQAQAIYRDSSPEQFSMGHADLARNLPAGDINDAMAMYQVSGLSDFGSANTPHYFDVCRDVANQTRGDFGSAYRGMIESAARAAEHLNYLKARHDINSFSDLCSAVSSNKSTHNDVIMRQILDRARTDLLSNSSRGNASGMFSQPPQSFSRS